MGESAAALQCINKADEVVEQVMGVPVQVEHYFFRALVYGQCLLEFRQVSDDAEKGTNVAPCLNCL